MNNLGEKYQEAKAKKVEEDKKQGKLPDLTCVTFSQEQLISEGDIEEADKELAKRREWAMNVADSCFNAQLMVRQIKENTQLLELDDFKGRYDKAKDVLSGIKKMVETDSSLEEQVEYHTLMCWIKHMLTKDELAAQDVPDILNRAIKLKRFRKVQGDENEKAVERYKKENDNKLPPYSLTHRSILYVPEFVFSENGTTMITNGLKALYSQLQSLLRKEEGSAAARFARKSNRKMKEFKTGEEGFYHFNWPKRTHPETGKKYQEGHALIRVVDLNKDDKKKEPYTVVRILEATGGSKWIKEKTDDCEDYRVRRGMPWLWYQEGRPFTKKENRLPDSDDQLARKVIFFVNLAIKLEEGNGVSTKPKNKTETKKPEKKTDKKEPAQKPEAKEKKEEPKKTAAKKPAAKKTAAKKPAVKKTTKSTEKKDS
jgi:hypothetical protein